MTSDFKVHFDGDEACNSRLILQNIQEHCELSIEGTGLFKLALERQKCRATRALEILRVARTIANIEGNENITLINISEALQFLANTRICKAGHGYLHVSTAQLKKAYEKGFQPTPFSFITAMATAFFWKKSWMLRLSLNL